jgi:hypothetical protein
MAWAEELAKVVAAGSFIACHNGQQEKPATHGPLHVRVYGSTLQLTCSFGAGLTLVYKEETMAALWALRCLTEGIDGVLGAIQSGSLIRWEANFWENTLTMPERKDTEKAMMRAVARWSRLGRGSYRPKDSSRLNGVPPNVSRETPEEM